MSQQRTWTAAVEVRESLGGRVIVEIPAATSEYDLLRDQTQAAVRESLVLLEEGEVSVVLYKTTQARGTERDRSFTVSRDRRGVVRYDGPYR